MDLLFQNNRSSGFFRKVISGSIVLAMLFNSIFPIHGFAQTVFNLPVPGTMVTTSQRYSPVLITGMTIHPQNPLKFDFIVDTGDDRLEGEALKKEANKLVNYFMATLTIPEDEMWVNLSPYERDRIIADSLSKTEMGRDMLAQDYILKQFTASLLYPEGKVGKEFWQRVYAQAQERLGTTEIPTDLFNKVWIVPQDAAVYINANNVFVTRSYLKVMLEQDYVAMSNQKGMAESLRNADKDDIQTIAGTSAQIIREVLLPVIEKEVNEGKNFANLRQIYHSMILATWYKKKLKNSLLEKVYLDQNKTNGIELEDRAIKEKIYQRYLEAYKKGVYNYIKEDLDPQTQEVIPRKYFSGGLKSPTTVLEAKSLPLPSQNPLATLRIETRIISDTAMLSEEIQHELLAVSLTSYCPVQCAFCFMSPTTERRNAVRLNDEMVQRIIDYINSKNFLKVYLTGGEPLSEMENVLKFIRETNVETIEIYTSGVFASTPNKAEETLDRIAQALDERRQLGKRPAKLLFRVSVDSFHSHVPLIYIERIIKLFKTHRDTKYKNMILGLKGIVASDDPILTVIKTLDGEIIDGNSDNSFPLKKVKFSDGYAFNVYYGEIKLIDEIIDSGITIPEAGRIYSRRIENDLIIMGRGNQGVLLNVSHNGDFSIHEYLVGQVPLANVRDENFSDKIDQRLRGDPFLIVLRKFGLAAVLKILKELERQDVIDRSIRANNQFLVITDIVKDSLLKSDVYRMSAALIADQDSAMVAASDDSTKGGIDFNADHLNLSEAGNMDEIEFSFDRLKDIDPASVIGIKTVVIDITPFWDINPLLGLPPQRSSARPVASAR